MRLTLSIAKRFLLSKTEQGDGFLAFISWVSVLGVSLGVLSLVVVMSVINGFENELSKVITSMNGDLIVYSQGQPLGPGAAERLEKTIQAKTPELRAMSHSFIAELMVSGPEGDAAGAVVEGIDLKTIGDVTELPRRVVKGELPAPRANDTAPYQVVLGSALANKIAAKPGDRMRLTLMDTPADSGSAGGGWVPRSIEAQVMGIVHFGNFEYDSKYLFCPLEDLQAILGLKGSITAVRLKLNSREASFEVSRNLTMELNSPLRVKNWMQLNRNLFEAIKLEKAVIAIILTAIILVAAFNVVSTLMMVIHDKSQEIAILKAMGLRASQARSLFMTIGVGMGLVGAAGGVVGGLLLNEALERTRLIDLPPDIYYISYLPVIARWSEIGGIALGAVLISFFATLYPAWSVAKRSPLEGLRNE